MSLEIYCKVRILSLRFKRLVKCGDTGTLYEIDYDYKYPYLVYIDRIQEHIRFLEEELEGIE